MSKTKLSLILGLLLSGSAMTAQATLSSTDGGLGVYDSVDHITWTSDANLLGTLEAANPNLIATIVSDEAAAIYAAYSHTLTANDFDQTNLLYWKGGVDWYGAQAYVDYLNTINYGNSNQWALPSAGSNPAGGVNQTGSQMGELFYTELLGTAFGPIPTNSLITNTRYIQYWSNGTQDNATQAWYFDTSAGLQGVSYKNDSFYRVWAVSPGQVTAAATTAPEPGIISLMIAGLLGLIAKRRRFAGRHCH